MDSFTFWSTVRKTVDLADTAWQIGWRAIGLVLFAAFTAVFIKEFLL